MDEPGEPYVRVRKRIVDWRRDHRADLRSDAARHLLRDQHIGQERTVWSMLFGRAGRNDDGMTCLQECLDFKVGHLAKEDGGRLHGYLLAPILYAKHFGRIQEIGEFAFG